MIGNPALVDPGSFKWLQQKNSIPVERRTLPPTMLSDELKRFNSLALSFECWRYPWP